MRLIGLVILALSLVLAPLGAEAQPERNVRTIGFLGPPPSAGVLCRRSSRIRVEYRYTDVPLQGDIDRMVQLAAELVRLKPDVLVVSITEAALAARSVTKTIPIVMANAADPVGAGLVSSLAHPGGNITGLTRLAPELVGKNLQILKEVMVLDAQNAARTLGVQLKILEARTPAEVERARCFSSPTVPSI